LIGVKKSFLFAVLLNGQPVLRNFTAWSHLSGTLAKITFSQILIWIIWPALCILSVTQIWTGHWRAQRNQKPMTSFWLLAI